MVKDTSLNRTKGSIRVIPLGEWRLWLDKETNINNSLINNNNNTKVSSSLIQNPNERNNFRGNPHTNNPTYRISDTGATQNYIKVDTPCENKVKTTQRT